MNNYKVYYYVKLIVSILGKEILVKVSFITYEIFIINMCSSIISGELKY